MMTDEEKCKMAIRAKYIDGGVCPGSILTGVMHDRPNGQILCGQCGKNLTLNSANPKALQWVSLTWACDPYPEDQLHKYLLVAQRFDGNDFLGKHCNRGEFTSDYTASLYDSLRERMRIEW